MNKNISIVWDFDGTLTPTNSTSKVIEELDGSSSDKFWEGIKKLRGERRKPKWEHILASDTPIWMYALSKIAYREKIPLNKEFFKELIVPRIKLYPNTIRFLKKVRDIQNSEAFKQQKIEIHHFIISAGLKELIEEFFPKNLITWTFGGRYTVIYSNKDEKEYPESIPAFCMDETMKTRAIFEITKGTFSDPDTPVNKRIDPNELKFPISNMIYIGDGPTDIPALALVRERGGLGVVVYNKNKNIEKTKRKLRQMSLDKRANLITPADFSLNGELFSFIKAHCQRILQEYRAQDIKSISQ